MRVLHNEHSKTALLFAPIHRCEAFQPEDAPKTPHPIVQIIDRNEQHVRLFGRFQLTAACKAYRKHHQADTHDEHKELHIEINFNTK